MTILRSGTKGDLNRRHCQHPANLLLNVIKEAVPTVHITKPEQADMIDSFKDVYHKAGLTKKEIL